MKTRIIGQIHDSLIADVPVTEIKQYVEICEEVMAVRILKAWPWIKTPLNVEVEIAPVGGTWADLEEYKAA
jgi:DNA polymerase I-like protein with 3'-5' exonuclease and polymerase domains